MHKFFHIKAIDKFPINLVFSESDFEFMKNKNSKIVLPVFYHIL